MGAGQTFQAAPDAGDAREAANNVMYLIDHKSKVDPYSDAGLKEPLTSSKIDFKSVDFTYPSRPNTQVYAPMLVGYTYMNICVVDFA